MASRSESCGTHVSEGDLESLRSQNTRAKSPTSLGVTPSASVTEPSTMPR